MRSGRDILPQCSVPRTVERIAMLITIALGALVLGLVAGRRGKAVAWAGGSFLAAVAGGIAGGASGGWSGLAAGAGTAVLAFNGGLMLVLLLELAHSQRSSAVRHVAAGGPDDVAERLGEVDIAASALARTAAMMKEREGRRAGETARKSIGKTEGQGADSPIRKSR